MANGKFNLGKQSGGVLSLTFPDGATNTEIMLPESGTVASINGTVTDNAIARYDGTTGELQDSGVLIHDNGNLLVGTTTDNGVDKLQVNGSISSGTIKVHSSGDLNNFKYITQTIGTYPDMSNIPINDHGYLEIIVYLANNYVMQRFTTLGVLQTAGRVFVRCLSNGTWSPWVEK